MSKDSVLLDEAVKIIKNVFCADDEDISDITVVKMGMTNNSVKFKCFDNTYILRIPGKGTEQLINRENEYNVYQAIQKYNICDEVCYMCPEKGYKITRYYNDARVCDAYNYSDVKRAMNKLRDFHNLEIKVDNTFDIFERITFYNSLWKDNKSVFRDHKETTEKVFELNNYINTQEKKIALSHIDSVADNFLFINKDGKEEIKLIDWEYAGMQDVCVDIAMFAIYSLYDREHVDKLIDTYYYEGCSHEKRLMIYCYISMCGLLWSNWCEYKKQLGIDFGKYAVMQYQFAKDYYNIFKEEKRK